MELCILTPEIELFRGSIKSVKVPGTKGQFQILKGHAAIVSSLDKGTIYVEDAGGTKHNFDIVRGFIEVLRDEVSLLVVTADTDLNGK
jgi:F-type H+-transporting ATPase subunit epsilon